MWLSPFFSSFDHNLYSLIARINHDSSREISIGGPISRGQVAARDISARFVLASRRRRAVRFPAGGNAIHGDTWSCKSYRVNCRVLGPVRAHFASILNANRPSLPAARAPPRLAVISFDDENSIYVCLGHRNASALVRYDGESSEERGFSFFFVNIVRIRGNRPYSLQEYLFARSSSIFVQGQDESGSERSRKREGKGEWK